MTPPKSTSPLDVLCLNVQGKGLASLKGNFPEVLSLSNRLWLRWCLNTYIIFLEFFSGSLVKEQNTPKTFLCFVLLECVCWLIGQIRLNVCKISQNCSFYGGVQFIFKGYRKKIATDYNKNQCSSSPNRLFMQVIQILLQTQNNLI